MALRKKEKKTKRVAETLQPGEPMEGGEEMRNLCEEIASSFDARVARVAALRQETAATLKGFRRDLRQKAAELKRFLSNADASRMRGFKAMHQGMRAQQEERNREVAGMLGGFRREHEAAGTHWQTMAATMAKRRASLAG
jgi:hypothetical protein